MTNATASTPNPRRSTGALALVVLGALVSALAVYQWFELIQVRNGAHALCSVNETINCETVWTSAMAERVHRWLGVPVAGLGLVWGLTATALAWRVVSRLRRGELVRPAVPAVRVTALVGVLACIVFAVGSFQSGALCLTCLGTYALVLAYAGVAFRGLPGPLGFLPGELRPAVFWAGGLAILFFVGTLVPGLLTRHGPQAPSLLARTPEPAAGALSSDPSERAHALTEFLGRLSPQERQGLSDALAAYRMQSVPMGAYGFRSRHHVGADDAPVKVVEFTDILCPHCQHLEENLAELEKKLPPGLMSFESRYFPLDGACNAKVQMHGDPDQSLTRCLGARVQVCLEKAKDFTSLRRNLFAQQASLTPDRVMEIAASGSVSRPELEACVNSHETEVALNEDIQMADAYKLDGTPFVIVNGKAAPPSAPFLYVLALTGGATDSPALASLPAPSPVSQTP